MNLDLLDSLNEPFNEEIAPQAYILHAFAQAQAITLQTELEEIIKNAPFRIMSTPTGFPLSVAMTNCGQWGWITDKQGYRYSATDPLSGRKWPPIPASMYELGRAAAQAVGFENFQPNACLINRYIPGAKMSLHQDKDERNFQAPIVSLSLGLPAIFLFGGFNRTDKSSRYRLQHGDVVVWGGASRLCYHGILPLKDGFHPKLGRCRINVTLRQTD